MKWPGILVLGTLGFTAAFGVEAIEQPAPDSTEQRQSLEQRIEQLKANIKSNPQNADLHYELSGLYREAENDEEAESTFDKGIGLDMAKKTVDEILQPCYDSRLIQKVVYDPKKKKTNFDELVYQEDLKSEVRMPVFVMFYGTLTEDVAVACEKREAIIFKELARRYKGKIRFAVYNDRSMQKMVGHNMSRLSVGQGITAVPSIAMYSLFDSVEGETPEDNDGRVKQVDILRGGPNANWRILGNEKSQGWLPFCVEWIDSSLTKLNNEWCWRLNNSSKERKVFYNNQSDIDL